MITYKPKLSNSGRVEVVRNLILQGADPNFPSPLDRKTALHYACAGGNLNVIKMLIEEFRARHLADRFGMLPIHEAQGENLYEVSTQYVYYMTYIEYI